MRKKAYQEPTMLIVKLQHTGMLMASGEVNATMSGTFTETDDWDEGSSVKAHNGNVNWDEEW